MREPALPRERLQEILRYDPQTGEFRWRVCAKPGLCVGEIAGSNMRSDYWCIHIDGRGYRAHQLAWLYMTGEWGGPAVDHCDGDPFNNRWRNLRRSNLSNTASRSRRERSNRQCFAGITLDRRSGQWTARISKGGRGYFLGRFPTNEAAHEAYATAARLPKPKRWHLI